MQQRLKQRILVFDRQCERKEINMSKQVSNKMHILNMDQQMSMNMMVHIILKQVYTIVH